MSGTWAVEIGIENNEAEMAAQDVLAEKKVEDIVNWHKKGQNFDTKSDTPIFDSLTKGNYSFLSSQDLNRIDPDISHEAQARIFTDVLKKNLLYIGKKEADGQSMDEAGYIQRGVDHLYSHYTPEGIEKLDPDGLSPSELERIKGEGKVHSFTFEAVMGSYMVMAHIEKAKKESAGLMKLKQWMVDSFKWMYKTGESEFWKIEDWTAEKAGEYWHILQTNYGPAVLQKMEEWGKAGYSYMLDKQGDLKVWWKGEGGIMIERIGDNLWHIAGTGVKLPFLLTLNATDWVAENAAQLIDRIDVAKRRGIDNEIEDFDIFNPELDPEASDIEINQWLSGYEHFGRFEEDFYKAETETGKKVRGGLLGQGAEKLTSSNIDNRFKMHADEGYVDFVGICNDPSITGLDARRQEAYRRGITELATYLKTHIPLIDHDSEPGKELIGLLLSNNTDALYDHLQRYVDLFVAFNMHDRGYYMCFQFSFPPRQPRSVMTGDEPNHYPNRYLQKITGDPHLERDFDDYKHSVRFSPYSVDNLTPIVFETLPGSSAIDWSGPFMKKYMEVFGLWTVQDADIFLNMATAILVEEGFVIDNYGEKDNAKNLVFEFIKKHRDRITGKFDYTTNFVYFKDMLDAHGEDGVVDRYVQINGDLESYLNSTRSVSERLRSVMKNSSFNNLYTTYLNRHLSKIYREEERDITVADLEKVTQQFIDETEGTLETLGVTMYNTGVNAVDLVSTLFDKLMIFGDVRPKAKKKL